MKVKQLNRLVSPLLGIFLLLVAVATTVAAPLPPGAVLENPVLGTPIPNYTLSGVPANFLPTADLLVCPFVGDLSGVVVSQVYQDPNTKDLAFAYIFVNTSSSLPFSPVITRATIGDAAAPWLGTTITDAGANSGGFSTAAPNAPNWTNGNPYYLLRDPTALGEGVAIQWEVANQGTVIAPGNVSALIWFATDAKFFQVANVGLTDSGAVATACAFAPAPIPEPASLVLYSLGLGLFGLVIYRRKQS